MIICRNKNGKQEEEDYDQKDTGASLNQYKEWQVEKTEKQKEEVLNLWLFSR